MAVSISWKLFNLTMLKDNLAWYLELCIDEFLSLSPYHMPPLCLLCLHLSFLFFNCIFLSSIKKIGGALPITLPLILPLVVLVTISKSFLLHYYHLSHQDHGAFIENFHHLDSSYPSNIPHNSSLTSFGPLG